jgi:hypothetical protein
MAFVRQGPSSRVVGVMPAEGRNADVRIRYTGGVTFRVDGGGRRRKTEFGRVIQVSDPGGRTHELVLRAFDAPSHDWRRDDDEEVPPTPGQRRS